LRPDRLTLEVTESSIMRNIETSVAVIQCVRELGFRLAIDDFGTGQASLTQLKRIPADELKIDKSFVQNLSNPHDEAIVRAAIELAHQFGLHAVAEGVEDQSSFDRLRALGCETAQGFHLARPLSPAAFVQWLDARRAARDPEPVRLTARAGA
jgi:EAL domain-containing protein (putative c-di-GMP-specific phosphodiesterase class I)